MVGGLVAVGFLAVIIGIILLVLGVGGKVSADTDRSTDQTHAAEGIHQAFIGFRLQQRPHLLCERSIEEWEGFNNRRHSQQHSDRFGSESQDQGSKETDTNIPLFPQDVLDI